MVPLVYDNIKIITNICQALIIEKSNHLGLMAFSTYKPAGTNYMTVSGSKQENRCERLLD